MPIKAEKEATVSEAVPTRGVSWADRRRLAGGALAVLMAGTTLAAGPAAMAGTRSGEGRTVEVIVRRGVGGDAADRLVAQLGGEVHAPLDLIDGFTAEVPETAVAQLQAEPAVAEVTPDGRLKRLGQQWRADKDKGTLRSQLRSANVDDAWDDGITGRGVGVALIDSGVLPVEGLTTPGKVVDGPDLSFESQVDGLQHLDTFGHGTHMAGIIAGRDGDVEPGDEDDKGSFVGVAPDASLLSLKVASVDGATDVSQVIAALDWVVQHRNDNGMNIRVVNLAYGTDGAQSYVLDPLAHAAEVAWRRGVVVVVSAGNDGPTTERLTNPAMDPYVLAVGASDHLGTRGRGDDLVADFSSRGSVERSPDLVAPGRSLVSLRAPGSFIDAEHPSARMTFEGTERLFPGSGTSQAAAFTSGVVALLLQQRPELTPDQVKALLTATADPIAQADRRLQGAGRLDVREALRTAAPATPQAHPVSNGTGSLEAARGTSHVADP
ncbi:hypothetical protein BH18ACT1_BH18ACT1_03570 [soil metagenome]